MFVAISALAPAKRTTKRAKFFGPQPNDEFSFLDNPETDVLRF